MNAEPRNLASVQASPSPNSRGLDFYRSDRSLTALLGLYLPEAELAHMQPWFERLGGLVGGALDELAREADKTPPRLEPRDRQGEDRQTIVKAPAYREMERLAFGELAMAAVSHRPALGWEKPLSAAGKYALTYLFAQSEFGLAVPGQHDRQPDPHHPPLRRAGAAGALPAGAYSPGTWRASCRAPCS